ncbi:MAG: hypothetical protein PGN23_16825 [Sphingomonas adhaesiva]|uniref:hypothetical protein n=1 Tax=Sphingomonas adhaesiva TaxID=28212 RepID=UPI002FF622D8
MSIAAAGTLLLALLYWSVVAWVANVTEPWDAPAYWYGWYPGALLLCALAGRKLGWGGGVVVVIAQAPVMWAHGALASPGWPVAVAFLLVLSIPAIAVAAVAGMRHRAL